MSPASTTRNDIQKIDVKIVLEAPAEFDWDGLLAVFGRWRLEEGEEIIDLADYLHVPEGPGCLLVSQLWHFGVDFADGEPGLFLSTRRDLDGEAADRFRDALRKCLEKGARLLDEPELGGKVLARVGELQVTINDRVLVPNTDESDAWLRPALVEALDTLFGAGSYEVERDDDPAHRLGWTVRAPGATGLSPREASARLAST